MEENEPEEMTMVWLLLPLLAILFYLLYIKGFLPVSSKRARSFIGTMGFGGSHCEASFTECHGDIHRVLRFQESRTYSFRLGGHCKKGAVTVQILDSQRIPALVLDMQHPFGNLSANTHQRYYLYVRFTDATGDYQLDWS